MIIGVGDCRRRTMVSSHKFAGFLISNIILKSMVQIVKANYSPVCPLCSYFNCPDITEELALLSLHSLPVPNHNASRNHGDNQLLVLKSQLFLVVDKKKKKKSLLAIETREVHICSCKTNKLQVLPAWVQPWVKANSRPQGRGESRRLFCSHSHFIDSAFCP